MVMTLQRNFCPAMSEKSDNLGSSGGSDNGDKTVIKPRTTQADQTRLAEPATNVRPDSNATVVSKLPDHGRSEPVVNADKALGKNQVGIGSIINNRFILEQQLGAGGMGIVYRALDKRKQEAEDKDPHVALKILGKELENHPQAFIALQRETRKSQTLAHPNIITVYDFDRDGDKVYMTMEELHGKTLEQCIKENPQGVEQQRAFKIIKSIAQGLAYAHSKDIIHSDLKPGNVFLTEKGDIKILDFGIARAVSSADDDANDKTVFDVTELGGLTPSYASTEMFAGKAPHASDDMYALGLIAYELLTGIHPYHRKPATKAMNEKLAAARLKGIKGHKAKALLAAVALQRDDRVQSAEQFLKAFDTSRSVTVIALSAALIAAIAVIALFQSGLLGNDLELPEELRTSIAQFVDQGNTALNSADYDAALAAYVQAYDVYPENPEALEGFNTLVVSLLNTDLGSLDRGISQERLRQVNILVQHRSQADNPELIDLRAKLQQYLGFTSK